MLSAMPTYIVTGFQNGSFRTYETKQATVGDAISQAESQGIELETIRCHATREVFRKEGREWTVDKYLPPKRPGASGKQTLLLLASFIIPVMGLAVGGFRAFYGLEGSRGVLIAGGLGLAAWAVGYVVISRLI